MNAARKAEAVEVTDPWVSLRQAAITLGESRIAVLQRIARGELTHQIVAGRTYVSRESVEQATR
jgi:hypothetical protein